MRLIVGALFAVLVSQAGAASSEFQVNTYTSACQQLVSLSTSPRAESDYCTAGAVAGIGDDRFVVTWATSQWEHYDGVEDRSYTSVVAQLFHESGRAIGAEFQVNTVTRSDQAGPAVTSIGNHSFVIVYATAHDNPYDWNNLAGQLFSVSGERIGSEFSVNTETYSHQTEATVSSIGDRFVVAWETTSGHEEHDGIFAQIFDDVGSKIDSQFKANTYTARGHYSPTVSRVGSDRFVIAWEQGWGTTGQDGSGYGVFAQLFDINGSRIGSEFQVHESTANSQGKPEAAPTRDGFVIVWHSYHEGASVYAQLFDYDASKNGSQFRVDHHPSYWQTQPVVAATGDGFVVAYQSYGQDGSGDGIFAQQFDHLGAKVGVEFQVNTFSVNHQWKPSVTGVGPSGFVITWKNEENNPASHDLYARLYGTSANPVPYVTLSGEQIPRPEFRKCALHAKWDDLITCIANDWCAFDTGSLGQLMQKDVLESWLCMSHPCTTHGGSNDTRFCFVYNEQTEVFIPWCESWLQAPSNTLRHLSLSLPSFRNMSCSDALPGSNCFLRCPDKLKYGARRAPNSELRWLP